MKARSGWLPDNRRVWFLAEHDGWMHLYTIDVTASAPARKQLTSGKFEIDQVGTVARTAARSTSSRPNSIPASAISTP